MRYKLIKLVLFGCLLSSKALAQEDPFIFSPDTVYKFQKPSLCSSLRLLDMRENKYSMGHVLLGHGMFQQRKTVIPESPLNTFLPEYFSKMLAGQTSGNDELLLVLYNFNIENSPNGDEISSIYFNADFYRGSSDQYTYLGKVDSMYELMSGGNASKKLVNVTAYKLCDIFSRFATSEVKSAGYYKERDLAGKRNTEHLKYPIYRDTNFKKGIYYTADQFVNNQPSDTPIVQEVYYIGDKREVRFHYANEKGKKVKHIDERDFFAVYDGKSWMVGINGHCEPMSYKNGEFYADRRFKGVKGNANVSNMGIMFGLAGALIASSASGGKERASWGLYRAKFDPDIKDFIPVKRIE